MKVVILCGGKGTRLREETEFRPKPMVPIGNRPILWHIMKMYAHFGHKEFILCLGYKGSIIKEFFLNYNCEISDFSITLGNNPNIQYHNQHDEQDWKVTLVDTGLNSATAFRVRSIRDYIGDDESFMLTYGDGVARLDIDDLVRFHHEKGKICTMTGVHPLGRFGEIETDPDSIAVEFNEKPQTEEGYINGGFMVCNRKMFDYLPDDPDMMLEQNPMRNLVADNNLAIYKSEEFWQCMDTYAESQFLNRLWSSAKAPWKVW